MNIFGYGTRGASHIRHDQPYQDSYAIRTNKIHGKDVSKNYQKIYSGMRDDIQIAAVADGHGSSSCPYSADGSRLAVNAFCDIMARYCCEYHVKMDDLYKLLKNESEVDHLSRAIEKEWKERVIKHYQTKKKSIPPFDDLDKEEKNLAIYKLYGTTLLGMVATKKFLFFFQIGDGDIVLVSEDNVEPMIIQEKILGVETHSLSKNAAWAKAHSSTLLLDTVVNKTFSIMMSTDGFSNSYASDEEYKKACVGYLDAIKEHGVTAVKENLPKWLEHTSENGCGDDITLVIAYFS